MQTLYHNGSLRVTTPLLIPTLNPATIRSRRIKISRIPKQTRTNSSSRDFLPPQNVGECPVPLNQQPLNEYQALSGSSFFSWALDDLWKLGLRFGSICSAFTAFLGWPVARVSVNPEQELLKCGVGALGGGLLIVTLVALRMYLGWAYVGNRLLSATVEYEETGWYDGEVWVKPPEILARDRLLGSYTVKPILSKVKSTLIVLSVSLFGCIILFFNLHSPNVNSPLILEGEGKQGIYNDSSAKMFEPEPSTIMDQEVPISLDEYCKLRKMKLPCFLAMAALLAQAEMIMRYRF